jgi:hypothetical protein
MRRSIFGPSKVGREGFKPGAMLCAQLGNTELRASPPPRRDALLSNWRRSNPVMTRHQNGCSLKEPPAHRQKGNVSRISFGHGNSEWEDCHNRYAASSFIPLTRAIRYRSLHCIKLTVSTVSDDHSELFGEGRVLDTRHSIAAFRGQGHSFVLGNYEKSKGDRWTKS